MSTQYGFRKETVQNAKHLQGIYRQRRTEEHIGTYSVSTVIMPCRDSLVSELFLEGKFWCESINPCCLSLQRAVGRKRNEEIEYNFLIPNSETTVEAI